MSRRLVLLAALVLLSCGCAALLPSFPSFAPRCRAPEADLSELTRRAALRRGETALPESLDPGGRNRAGAAKEAA